MTDKADEGIRPVRLFLEESCGDDLYMPGDQIEEDDDFLMNFAPAGTEAKAQEEEMPTAEEEATLEAERSVTDLPISRS